MVSRPDQVEGEEGALKHLTKKEKQDLFKGLCEKGPKYVIDCQFEDYMTDRELKSLGQQLAYCHSINKRLEQPLNIFVTGVGPRLQKIIQQQNCQHWAMNISFLDITGKEGVESQYLSELSDQLPKESLVYLTADSTNLISDLDPTKVYLIGGIVDHNRHKLLTFNKANNESLETGRLPIKESGVQLTTSAVLTVNHVFDIIARYHSIGPLDTSNARWKQALEEAIPGRKRKEDPTVVAVEGEESCDEPKEEAGKEEEEKSDK